MLNLKYWVILAILCISAIGCTELAPIAAKAITGASDSGISADLQNGDRKNDVNLGGDESKQAVGDIKNSTVTVNQAKTHSTINAPKASKVTVNEANPWLVLGLCVLCLICWVLPSPRTCYAWLKSKYNQLRGIPNV